MSREVALEKALAEVLKLDEVIYVEVHTSSVKLIYNNNNLNGSSSVWVSIATWTLIQKRIPLELEQTSYRRAKKRE